MMNKYCELINKMKNFLLIIEITANFIIVTITEIIIIIIINFFDYWKLILYNDATFFFQIVQIHYL